MWKTFVAIISAIVIFFSSLLGLPLSDGSVENEGYIYKNMEYGYHKRQVVDLYLPKNSDGKVGLILLIHGGAWIAGDKDAYNDLARYYANKFGCAVAALNYRYISSIYDIHDELDDIDMCLARIKAKAQEKDIILTGMLLTGHSAGAHLSMLYAYSRKDTAPVKPKAVVNYSGPTDLVDENYYNNDNPLGTNNEIASLFSNACGKRFRYKNRTMFYNELMAVSPVAYVDMGTVPTVINHGVMDSIVPFSNAETLASKLDECGVKYDFNVFPNSNHGLESDPDKWTRSEELFEEYMIKYIGVEKSSGVEEDKEDVTQPTTEAVTTAPTTEPTTQPTTKPTTTEPTIKPTTQPSTVDEKAYRIENYKNVINKQEIYLKITSKDEYGTDMPVEFARNSKGDMYRNTVTEDMTMKLYYTKSSDKMNAYMYLSDSMVDELMAGDNEVLKLFLKGVINLIDTLPLHTEVPKSEMESMDIDEILDAITIKNVGTIKVGADVINGKTVVSESFVDTATGDTKKYYFDGDKLVAVDTIYKNERIGTERILIHEVSNKLPNSVFNQPWPKINLPEDIMI